MCHVTSDLTSDGVPETESAKPSWPSLPQGETEQPTAHGCL